MKQKRLMVQLISRHTIITALVLIAVFASQVQAEAKWSANKKALISSVDKHEKNLIVISDKIWSYAELALMEHQSAKVLSDYAENNGFTVDRGILISPSGEYFYVLVNTPGDANSFDLQRVKVRK